MLSRNRAGVAGRDEGTVGGIPFKEDPNAPRPRSGGPAGGAARGSKNDPGKKDGPPWRNCLEERQPLAALNASAGSGGRRGRAVAGLPGGRMKRLEVCRDLARTWTTPVYDTAGRDDARGAGRSRRSSRLVEMKSELRATRLGGGCVRPLCVCKRFAVGVELHGSAFCSAGVRPIARAYRDRCRRLPLNSAGALH